MGKYVIISEKLLGDDNTDMNYAKLFNLLLLLLVITAFAACGQQSDTDPDAVNIEVKCECADVYQVFYSSYIDGQYYGMGAAADMNGGMITSDMVLKTVLTRSYFEKADISSLAMDFSPYGKDESYEMGTTNQVQINAEYGKTYTILITGDKDSGFVATLQE